MVNVLNTFNTGFWLLEAAASVSLFACSVAIKKKMLKNEQFVGATYLMLCFRLPFKL